MQIDWRLKFTNAYHGKNIQKIIKEIFGNEEVVQIDKETFEQIVVQSCALIMEGQNENSKMS